MQQLVEIEAAARCADPGFLDAVFLGLSSDQKTLPSRFFYDKHGSELFEEITALAEYYPTRAEVAILKAHGLGIASGVPSGAAVVEFGSGSSRKTELLLEALDRPAAYVPIEISASALYPAARRVQDKFPGVLVRPVLGGFHELDSLKLPFKVAPSVGFFPGSTIGNMTPAEATVFLRSARRFLGSGARFIVGADLQKPLDILLPAYDDAAGVTAAFNRNILTRINRELDGNFDPALFDHLPLYNEAEGRIEMHLRASKAHWVSVAGRGFEFAEGETIHTENSYKYTVPGFEELARGAGWTPLGCWTGENDLFSIHLLG